ncbi:HalOD1 output domain-containing protein [Haloarcula brevis]|uniref:HalOD1 output domain-containing protein n=1 Tax=Haloarcula brevis TaxID=3111453 RepID=UPI00387EB90D
MDPLHASVDPDALDSLVTPRRAAVGDVHLTFEYQGCEVTASSSGSIKVKPLHASTSSTAEDD